MSGLSEVNFGFDNFQQPKTLSPRDSIAQVILNLFMMRPGNMPSNPDIGIDIRQYMYRLEGDIDVEELKEKIFTQCSELLAFVSIGEIQVLVTPHEGQSILLVILPLVGFDEEDDASLIMGFRNDANNEVLFNYQFEQGKFFN